MLRYVKSSIKESRRHSKNVLESFASISKRISGGDRSTGVGQDGKTSSVALSTFSTTAMGREPAVSIVNPMLRLNSREQIELSKITEDGDYSIAAEEGNVHESRWTHAQQSIPLCFVLTMYLFHAFLGPLGLTAFGELKKDNVTSCFVPENGIYTAWPISCCVFAITAIVQYILASKIYTALDAPGRARKLYWLLSTVLFPFLLALLQPKDAFLPPCMLTSSQGPLTPFPKTKTCIRLDAPRIAALGPDLRRVCGVGDADPIYVSNAMLKKYNMTRGAAASFFTTLYAIFDTGAERRNDEAFRWFISDIMCPTLLMTPCDADCRPRFMCDAAIVDIVGYFLAEIRGKSKEEIDGICAKGIEGLRNELGQNFDEILGSLGLQPISDVLLAMLSAVEDRCSHFSTDFTSITIPTVVLGKCIDSRENKTRTYKQNSIARDGNCSEARFKAVEARRSVESEEWRQTFVERNKAQLKIQQSWMMYHFRTLNAVYTLLIAVPACSWFLSSRMQKNLGAQTVHWRSIHSLKTLTCLILLFMECFVFLFLSLKYFLPQPNLLFAVYLLGSAAYFSFQMILILIFAPNTLSVIKTKRRESSLGSSKIHIPAFIRNGTAKLRSYRRLYKSTFGLKGKFYLLKASILDMVSMIVQINAFVDLVKTEDQAFILAFASVLVLHGASSGYLFYESGRSNKGQEHVIAICGAAIDASYLALNVISIGRGEPQKMNFGDILRLMDPVFMLLRRTRNFSLLFCAMNANFAGDDDNTTPSVLSSTGKSLIEKLIRITRIIKLCTSAIAFSMLLFAISIIIVICIQIRSCARIYDPCVWSKVYPRIYFEHGIMSGPSCSTQHQQFLNLASCNTHGSFVVPESLSHFTNVEVVKLGGPLKVFPVPLFALAMNGSLVSVDAKDAKLPSYLDFSGLRLQEIPRVILRALSHAHKESNVLKIDVSDNNLGDLEAIINAVKYHDTMQMTVEELNADQNEIERVPETLFLPGLFPRLQILSFRNNRIARFGNLEALWLSNERDRSYNLEGNNLEIVSMQTTNEHISSIPKFVFDHSESLKELTLANSKHIYGPIPSQVYALSKLTTLALYSNSHNGTIQTEIGKLTNLENLMLYNNKLAGAVPTQVGLLSKLQTFKIHGNRIGGILLPNEMGKLTKLRFVNVGNMEQNNPVFIPDGFRNCKNLTYLHYAMTRKSGSTIPSVLGTLTSLTTLELYENGFRGAIPKELGKLTRLKTLSLRCNDFSNLTIPSSVGALNTVFGTHLDFVIDDMTQYERVTNSAGCLP